jgi:DNA-binding cell septation regulator SpoVG
VARSGDPWLSVAITKWTKATEPIGARGCVVGFIAISWHGLIVEGFQVINGPRGLFLEMPTQRTRTGRWLRLVRFRTVAEQEAFKTEVLAALMKAYPEDFVGLEAAKPRIRRSKAA